jgi:ketosteroid isomerase-like protein
VSADTARTELTVLFEEWLARLSDPDPAFFERTLDPDWVYTDIAGTVRGKQEYLAYIGGASAGVTGRLLELTPRLYGDIALVTGRYGIEGKLADGTDVSSSTRFTAVWKRTPAGWRALAHHATRIADA